MERLGKVDLVDLVRVESCCEPSVLLQVRCRAIAVAILVDGHKLGQARGLSDEPM